ncbi:protein deacetylase sirtuin-6 [Seminavis robusta]|uniref:protein acetyllysine N-acetyltransferase n=1 Tax=Seminavis robusta TaxID=568900 RepID=A0A9N8HEJ5_9STRA|nr:protein deacetylase sirtuin-6 [Seminavis robusta]|eukprot:Sro409_g137200.1 protein deacetylase sirtuin-6 (532) ;mRNA; f:35216-37143
MSSGYASRLSEYKDKGVCGLPEIFDSNRALNNKMKKLVQLIREAKRVVVITGAGISTSAGIPDFRGPSELENFADAQPTICHRAITKLVQEQLIHYVITQNVDGLHRRSGLSRNHHACVHGCVFTEKCQTCKAEYFRDSDVGGMSFQPTGRTCDLCGQDGQLCDTLLDWEDALPEHDFERATIECTDSVVLCLGTSLRIEPVGSLPELAQAYIICNLQKTPMDDGAALVLRAPVDQVMDQLVCQLGFSHWKQEPPPPIERIWKPPVETTAEPTTEPTQEPIISSGVDNNDKTATEPGVDNNDKTGAEAETAKVDKKTTAPEPSNNTGPCTGSNPTTTNNENTTTIKEADEQTQNTPAKTKESLTETVCGKEKDPITATATKQQEEQHHQSTEDTSTCRDLVHAPPDPMGIKISTRSSMSMDNIQRNNTGATYEDSIIIPSTNTTPERNANKTEEKTPLPTDDPKSNNNNSGPDPKTVVQNNSLVSSACSSLPASNAAPSVTTTPGKNAKKTEKAPPPPENANVVDLIKAGA